MDPTPVTYHIDHLVRNGAPEAIATGFLRGKDPLQEREDFLHGISPSFQSPTRAY